MTPATRPLVPVLVMLLAACGCGDRGRPPNPDVPAPPMAGGAALVTPDGAFTRMNFLRLEPGLPEAELARLFGRPAETESERADIEYEWVGGRRVAKDPNPKPDTKYTWRTGREAVTATVRGGAVVRASYPGQHEEVARRNRAYQAATFLLPPLREYAVAHGNQFPAKLEDLDLTALTTAHPEIGASLKAGDVVVPWGQSANRLVWAYWRHTPEVGGPYLRFDGKRFDRVAAAELAALDATVLTAGTVPADILAAGQPGPGERSPFADERSDRGNQGFITSHYLAALLAGNPANLDAVPKHLVRDWAAVEVLRRLEKGELVVRWGRDPKTGVFAHPRGFPAAGSLAIYRGQWVPFAALEDARKAFDE